jgi:hypothetical protein
MATQDRKAYAIKVNTDLNEASTKLSILEAAARQRKGDTRFDYESRLGNLRQERDEIAGRVTGLEDETAEDWETSRREIETDIQHLEDDIARAMDEAGLTSEREKQKSAPSRSGTDEELKVP